MGTKMTRAILKVVIGLKKNRQKRIKGKRGRKNMNTRRLYLVIPTIIPLFFHELCPRSFPRQDARRTTPRCPSSGCNDFVVYVEELRHLFRREATQGLHVNSGKLAGQ